MNRALVILGFAVVAHALAASSELAESCQFAEAGSEVATACRSQDEASGNSLLQVKSQKDKAVAADVEDFGDDEADDDEAPLWKLGMTINPSDGHNFGYGGPWVGNNDVGNSEDAFTKDFLDSSVWKEQVGYVTITRHNNGLCEMSKTWKLTDNTKSMQDYFSTYPGRIYATGDGTAADQHISADMPTTFDGQTKDPIFGANGGLVFNWYYSNNGARIAVPGGYKNPYNLPGVGENVDDLHGLGNEFGARTSSGGGSSAWWHDAAQLSGDCHGTSCRAVGTDHGTHVRGDGVSWGSYSIYVSQSSTKFSCQGQQLQAEYQAADECDYDKTPKNRGKACMCKCKIRERKSLQEACQARAKKGGDLFDEIKNCLKEASPSGGPKSKEEKNECRKNKKKECIAADLKGVQKTCKEECPEEQQK